MELIVYFVFDDFNKVECIPTFRPVFTYANIDCSNVSSEEFGKIVMGEHTIKFYGVSEIITESKYIEMQKNKIPADSEIINFLKGF